MNRTSTQERNRRNSAKRYASWLRYTTAIKLTAGCADCGYDEHPAALDFDHVLGVKSEGVAKMYARPRAVANAEIAKCEVVCANCHRIRTHPGWIGLSSEGEDDDQ